jgi:hypothetical protein
LKLIFELKEISSMRKSKVLKQPPLKLVDVYFKGLLYKIENVIAGQYILGE